MPEILNDDNYLLGLLVRDRLISSEQEKFISARKAQQRQILLRQHSAKRKTDTGKEWDDSLNFVDIIVSLNLDLSGKKGHLLTEELIFRAVAKDLGLPFKKLDPLELDLKIVTKTIPRTFAFRHLLLPFAMSNGVLEVAICNPENKTVLAEIERANQLIVKPYLATKSDIRKTLAEFFGFQSSITAAESHLARPLVDLGNLEQYVRISSTEEAASSDQHVTSAVDHMFNYAFEQRASDIHIEPKREQALVRLRIDGVLHTIYKLPKVVHAAVVSRIKSLARMDIAEKRRPQDGRIKVDRGGLEAEIRVSTVPVAFGEKAVLRILDPDILFQDVAKIGFSERDLQVYQSFMTAPHGIFLVTGPTGSGKSTTLYSTLKQIATPEKNVVTVEDPVEMVHEEFNQIPVQPQLDVTFSTILRNILRQDPDIIMIGEIRDLDTAVNAIQAALTGHLVFSTLHTNDAVASISRLLDLGVQPFMVGSTLLGAMAQRLVRRICPHCSEIFRMSADELRGFGLPVPLDDEGEFELHRGKGCQQCRGTGYLGRCGIFEIFAMTDNIRKQISAGNAETEIRQTAREEGMTTLKEDAWRKVRSGITTPEEALRVTGAD
ncbi:MAG TPA: type II secretion system protein E [Desulfobulbaceae bacterium]|nr:MAG: type II secretion system protein E [Deltaproteobacteria bacterium RIFOXYD12_FULL_53_23]HCC54442.1 type II secretion system protein E [Desulfobulbaceae bacterium]